ncbi:MAG: DNA replication/repair protein RecF [Clostridiales bacterium]|nr:DNA replication/repair protein RecF [Clostridiales bacterium]
MQLTELFLSNYRNYNNLALFFHADLICFIGFNAQGKTNILESIFLSCTGRSHRTPRDRELIQWGKEEALIRTKVNKQLGVSEIAIGLSNSEKKKILINQSPATRMGELMGHLNSVMFSPEDLKLVREGPQERRRFMDMELSQVKPKYFYHLQQYNRVLNQRNRLLKEIPYKPSLMDTLPVWDKQLAEAGSYIIMQRRLFCDALQTIAEEIHKQITHGSEQLSVLYKSSIPFNKETANQEEIQENFLKELERKQADDTVRGTTSRGCHRDDLIFQINGIDVRTFGSQGQKRTTVLSLKLSELEFMAQETGEYPLLLLDDAMSELDFSRQKMILKYIDKAQTFITLTDLDQIPSLKSKSLQVFEINSGNALPIQS